MIMPLPVVSRMRGMDNRRPQIAYGWRGERANEKMNDTVASLAPKPPRPGATNMGKP
jgi:hypothetical protein